MTGPHAVRLVAAMLCLGLGGCAAPRGAQTEGHVPGEPTLRLELVEWNEATASMLRQALPAAEGVLGRWGGLSEPVRITVFNAHWELEEAVGRKLPGISAWARRNQVLLWDPRWWPVPPGIIDPDLAATVRRIQVTDLLEHELTHCLMFQRAGPSPTDPRERIPFWFREGMATLTASEGSQWPPPETLSQWLARHPGTDLLRDAAVLSRTDPAIAYGAAYHAFDFLVRRYGDATVLRVLDRMRERDGFPDAFRDAVGVSVDSFSTDFRRYLSWRGFQPAAAPPP